MQFILCCMPLNLNDMYTLTKNKKPEINKPVLAYDGEDYYMAVYDGKEWIEHTVFTRTHSFLGLDLIQYADEPIKWMYP